MAQPSDKPCPICKLEQQDVRVWDYGERQTVECHRCGTFTITASAKRVAENRTLGPKISAWLRRRSDAGADIPEVNSHTLNDIEVALPTYRVSEKQLLILRSFERRTEFPGQEIFVSLELDYPLAWATGEDEFRYLLRALMERGLIRRTDGPADLKDSFAFKFEITAAGWTFLDERARPSVISDQVFVAMCFASELKPAWEIGIRPPLAKSGFRPYRVDAEPHIDRIDTRIVTEIKNSRFLVADVTMQRAGVYFEAGYALGIGIPVFWCVRYDDLLNVHFDTRQYNHIVWNNEQHLAEQLFFYVSAIIGRGSAN